MFHLDFCINVFSWLFLEKGYFEALLVIYFKRCLGDNM